MAAVWCVLLGRLMSFAGWGQGFANCQVVEHCELWHSRLKVNEICWLHCPSRQRRWRICRWLLFLLRLRGRVRCCQLSMPQRWCYIIRVASLSQRRPWLIVEYFGCSGKQDQRQWSESCKALTPLSPLWRVQRMSRRWPSSDCDDGESLDVLQNTTSEIRPPPPSTAPSVVCGEVRDCAGVT